MELAHKKPSILEESGDSFSQSKNRASDSFKRIFDLGLAIITLPFALPILMVIFIFIKLDSRGPIFFSHKRIGKNGKPFTCYKFRTMVVNAEELRKKIIHLNEMTGPAFKIKNDPRITPIGRFLRKYSLDELPQILNILKGEMSFVGPRPPLPEEVGHYQEWQKRRLSVTPGLTCFWQINGRNQIYNFNDWVKMDLDYIEKQNLKMDIIILFKTVGVVLKGTGQ